MKNTMKLLAAVLMALGAGKAFAADSDDVALSVTVSNQVSVSVLDATYDFGPVALSAVTVNTSGIRVDNDAGGIREDYRLSMVDATDGWSAGAAAASNTYNLRALFVSAAPAQTDFAANDDLTTTVTAADDTVYGPSGSAGCVSAESGCNVSDVTVTHERTLWFRLAMPTGISAQPSSPFATVWVSAIAG